MRNGYYWSSWKIKKKVQTNKIRDKIYSYEPQWASACQQQWHQRPFKCI